MRRIRAAARTMLKHLALVLISLGVTLALVEVALAINGRYNSLAAPNLAESDAIWEPRANSRSEMRHHDLDVMIEARFDAQGVRNHSALSTERKRNIVGVFGDSFTENTSMDDQFVFTSLLDSITGSRVRVVNYGVAGYGLDQAYLRYRKYAKHDMRHVVYLFCDNDLRNLYETGLAEITPEHEVVFRAPRVHPVRRFLGRLRVTYLALRGYYQIVGILSKGETPHLKSLEQGGDSAWVARRKTQAARYHDAFADAVARDFLSERPRAETLQLSRTFLLVLEQWQREVTSRSRTFTVLVLPGRLVTEVAGKLLREFDGRVIYLGQDYGEYDAFKFRNDGHWNEYGNLRAAEIIANHPDVPFHDDIVDPALLEGWKPRIDEYYREHASR